MARCLICYNQTQREKYKTNIEFRDKKIITKQIYQKRNRKEIEQFIFSYLITHPCNDCGEKNPLVLQFDHIKNKKFNIGDCMKLRVSKNTLSEEINKCVIRCANCHTKKTAIDFKHWKIKYI